MISFFYNVILLYTQVSKKKNKQTNKQANNRITNNVYCVAPNFAEGSIHESSD